MGIQLDDIDYFLAVVEEGQVVMVQILFLLEVDSLLVELV